MSEEDLSDQGIILPIEWHVPDTLHNQYVHHMIAQPGTHEVTLLFLKNKYHRL